jgi:hypothetical protein
MTILYFYFSGCKGTTFNSKLRIKNYEAKSCSISRLMSMGNLLKS